MAASTEVVVGAEAVFNQVPPSAEIGWMPALLVLGMLAIAGIAASRLAQARRGRAVAGPVPAPAAAPMLVQPRNDDAVIDQALSLLARANPVLIITGAGISVDSGLPTYRGTGGLYNGSTPDGMPIETALSRQMLHQQPSRVWHYLSALERTSRAATPNAGHLAIAEYQARNPNCWLMTQNIDGLHLKAGSPADRVLEVHGNLTSSSCMECCAEYAWPEIQPSGEPAPCPACGGQLRPSVVLFGEVLPDRIQSALRGNILGPNYSVVLSVGTSFTFSYISNPLVKARATGGLCVEVNPEETEGSCLADVLFKARASEALPLLLGR